ncbi:MFS transporter [Flexivirga caeni]|uniref:MFS transporter n=1 Tax=Flexivirga caeni TaxID=2294115 RepID=A0A3M9MGB5_9MICO|nr:MFS transporter [Flexivirga caeni]RNI24600.1 MFS transporter [Flexivirga caeni]
MTTTEEAKKTDALWRNGDYVRLVTGETISKLGSSMAAFVLPLMTLALTGSAAKAGVVGGASTLATVLFSLLAGALVDRWHRKLVMITSSAVRALLWSSIVIAQTLHRLSLAQLVVVGFLSSTMASFFGPAEGAAIRKVVRTEQLPAALSVNQGRQAAANLAGGPLGGVLFGINQMFPFTANALSFFASVVGVASVRHPLGKPERKVRESVIVSIRTGLRFVWSQPAIRDICATAAIINFALTGFDFTIILHLKRNGVPAALIGFIGTASGAGIVLGAMIAPRVPKRIPTGTICVALGWVLLVAYSVMDVFRNSLPVQVTLVFFGLLMVPILNAGLQAYSFAITPDELQGRVRSAISFMAGILTPFTAFLGGLGLEYLGAFTTLSILVVILATSPVLLTMNKHVRSIPLLSEVEPAE